MWEKLRLKKLMRTGGREKKNGGRMSEENIYRTSGSDSLSGSGTVVALLRGDNKVAGTRGAKLGGKQKGPVEKILSKRKGPPTMYVKAS